MITYRTKRKNFLSKKRTQNGLRNQNLDKTMLFVQHVENSLKIIMSIFFHKNIEEVLYNGKIFSQRLIRQSKI